MALMCGGMGALILCRRGRLRARATFSLFVIAVMVLMLFFFNFSIKHPDSFDANDVRFSGYQGKPGPAYSLTGVYNGTDQIKMSDYYEPSTVEQQWSIAWHPGAGWNLMLTAIMLLLVQMLPLGYLVYKFGRAPPPPSGGEGNVEQPVKGDTHAYPAPKR